MSRLRLSFTERRRARLALKVDVLDLLEEKTTITEPISLSARASGAGWPGSRRSRSRPGSPRRPHRYGRGHGAGKRPRPRRRRRVPSPSRGRSSPRRPARPHRPRRRRAHRRRRRDRVAASSRPRDADRSRRRRGAGRPPWCGPIGRWPGPGGGGGGGAPIRGRISTPNVTSPPGSQGTCPPALPLGTAAPSAPPAVARAAWTRSTPTPGRP